MDEVTLGATFALYYTRSMLWFSFACVKNMTLKLRRNTLVFFFLLHILFALHCTCGMSSELKNYTSVALRQIYHL